MGTTVRMRWIVNEGEVSVAVWACVLVDCCAAHGRGACCTWEGGVRIALASQEVGVGTTARMRWIVKEGHVLGRLAAIAWEGGRVYPSELRG